MNASLPARQSLVASLRREMTKLEAGQPPADDRSISTGSPPLDCLLPTGGLRRGTLVEYLTSAAGSGTGTLALSAAREACREGQALVVLDRPVGGDGTWSVPATYFYPPAAAAWGIDLARLLVLRPASEADALWAFDQALRCPGVGAVWATWDRLDVRDFRRLQLAAERGQTLGLLVRPARHRGQPTWADVQWQVGAESQVAGRSRRVHKRSEMHLFPEFPAVHFVRGGLMYPTWQLRVELVRCRGGTAGAIRHLEFDESAGVWRELMDHATHSVPRSAQLADSTPARRA